MVSLMRQYTHLTPKPLSPTEILPCRISIMWLCNLSTFLDQESEVIYFSTFLPPFLSVTDQHFCTNSPRPWAFSLALWSSPSLKPCGNLAFVQLLAELHWWALLPSWTLTQKAWFSQLLLTNSLYSAIEMYSWLALLLSSQMLINCTQASFGVCFLMFLVARLNIQKREPQIPR